MGRSVNLPDISGRRVISGFITASAVLATAMLVDVFIPGGSFVPDFIAPFAKLVIAVGAASAMYRWIKE